ncbi:anhydro-N-acetylmuramic acid kinase [Amycolatopsis mediterranei S699]|uniref:Anhydro-N-acetylmuramic acid kinase n=2 Tax=Amycolatopsis mediterranei TaxID=33910 RepID=A0A0H3D050_AMYMU|nr:anhydro-N-acetylmuramic acid kinase [Amycolatopsis mediterranei]ADJ43715.1 anhydro-N-acetylmuramic acid kinase [Amycolatopsis mediterranei U32]AEK40424.1 anhydro-N-acetylmuramic acid kinase [Amycolatopsis mediterranei S699]AFO75427.1 anhydro-N-acetylmuramic acid kinase [Amycolatopsis mediterranei S699]AGT82556.1 anhydro-N-acetylmuramic acid kinase [Amycolatopsis mediterranei RB]KDO10192.1 anhydro-N-acetylmuramic acid kinase [Amycolatopsis mediterranei]
MSSVFRGFAPSRGLRHPDPPKKGGHAFRVIGLISGTSIDGIDVAAAGLHAEDGTVVLTPLGELDVPYPEPLRDGLLAALPPNPCTAGELTRLDTGVGQAFADAAGRGVAELAGGRADLVASLGQTVFHWVSGGHVRGTLQLGQPAWIAERTGLPVCADLRARDVAAGGHGAPLASTLDQLWLRGLAEDTGRPVAALNLGGIANITVVAEDAPLIAYDTGPANALLDVAAHRVTGQRSDVDGRLALGGSVRSDLLLRLLADPYFAAAPPKSTGKEHFNADYLDTALAGLDPVDSGDLLATLTELTAVTVADQCRRHGVTTVIASGGGVANPALMTALTRNLSTALLKTSDDLGLPGAGKEAYLAALLGWLTWCGVPGTVPSATGARGPRVLGVLVPGRGPLILPAPLGGAVTRLRVAEKAG